MSRSLPGLKTSADSEAEEQQEEEAMPHEWLAGPVDAAMEGFQFESAALELIERVAPVRSWAAAWTD